MAFLAAEGSGGEFVGKEDHWVFHPRNPSAVLTDLTRDGLVLQTLEEHRLPFTLGAVVLSAHGGGMEESGCGRSELRATKGKVTRTLDTTGYCGSSDISSFSAVVVTADGKFIIPIISSGCAASPTKWVKSFAVATLLKPRPSK